MIDREARERLDAHIAQDEGFRARCISPGTAPAAGNFVAPHIFELKRADELTEEVFGPVLHVVRYPASELGQTSSRRSRARATG